MESGMAVSAITMGHESSECATRRQHKMAEVACYRNPRGHLMVVLPTPLFFAPHLCSSSEPNKVDDSSIPRTLDVLNIGFTISEEMSRYLKKCDARSE